MKLNLKFGLTFEDLYCSQKLVIVDKLWNEFLQMKNSELFHKLLYLRQNSLIDPKEYSSLIVDMAPLLEDFLAALFDIQGEVTERALKMNSLAPLYIVKRLFIQRQAAKSYNEDVLKLLPEALNFLQNHSISPFDELAFANCVLNAEKNNDNAAIEQLRIYAAWAVNSDEGKQKHQSGILFKVSKKTDIRCLVPLHKINKHHFTGHNIHLREGFSHTDSPPNDIDSLDQANYCIHCHKQDKDSCSKGFKDKPTNLYKVNEQKVTLTGCPLEEKISEMNLLKTQGSIIGAIAVAIIDNPMVAGTGHRICNDCMKSCIYQKQDPVNIPLVETNALNALLDLPWGFEIYSLLTRWNPLKLINHFAKPVNNKKVLVAGLGPAGYTLSHYLLNEGYLVVGIDGLKIEPLNVNLSGVDSFGKRSSFKPIYDVKKELYEDLGTRKAYGFGGVAEYGITVRWNKNYLKVIRLLLERRENFRMYGGIRFGSNIDYQACKELGFDHLALAFGAGKPNLIDVPNGFAKGVRTASDFLMTLQLSGAARKNSISNMQMRLPVIVIGGGLTAIDTATESLAYYPVQVEKFLKRWENLGDLSLLSLHQEEKEIAIEFIAHAKLLRQAPYEKLKLINSWGGVKIAYRKTLQDSPAYRLNHEEVEKALNEGIEFIENAIPLEIRVNANGSAREIDFGTFVLPACTILIAAGTQPNVILAKEDPVNFVLNGNYFRSVDAQGNLSIIEKTAKPYKSNVIHNIDADKFATSFFGDLHPSYAGNVVKAMASAKQGYPEIVELLNAKVSANNSDASDFFKNLDHLLISRIEEVIRLTPNIVEVVIKSPLAAKAFKPGQFYRLQNFEIFAIKTETAALAMEGIALTGASVDHEAGTLSTIVLEIGGSSNLCQHLKIGEPVVLMGPTGTPTEIPENKTVMLVGGGLGNAVLFSIGQAMREKGCKVIYFAGYKNVQDRYKMHEIEKASNLTIWCCDEAEVTKNRLEDRTFYGNIVEAIKAYGEGKLGRTSIKLDAVDHLIAIGSDRMMAAVAYARHNQLKHLFNTKHIALGSINSPMQCMMKEICGQCIQRHLDPVTGKESYVYSCYNQDQMLDYVDFKHLNNRLSQNSLQEKQCSMWIEQQLKNL